MRTTIHALNHWLENDFDGFFRVQSRIDVTQCERRMTVYRSNVHSFWHDNIEDYSGREKLWRRVHRFLDLANDNTPGNQRDLLFIRSVAGTSELSETERLYELLQMRFGCNGRKVYLLIIVEDQPIVGPILHTSIPEIFFWVQPSFKGKLSAYLEYPAPFEDAVVWAVRRVVGDPLGLTPEGEPGKESWPSVTEASALFSPDSEFCKAGLHETDCGVWAGSILVNAIAQEVMLAAFDGIDKISGDMSATNNVPVSPPAQSTSPMPMVAAH